jgi:Fe-S-cluster containining protein
MIELKALVPEEVCLSCDGCCRYADRDSVWSPLFLFEEILELTQKNIVPSCLFTHPNIHQKKPARIDLVESDNGLICPCLEIKTNTCKIYSQRPFDCRLYPYLLTRRGADVFLAIDEKCPYAKKSSGTPADKSTIAYLKNFLESQDFICLARKNPEIVQVYTTDVKFLSPLPELTAALYGTSASHRKR